MNENYHNLDYYKYFINPSLTSLFSTMHSDCTKQQEEARQRHCKSLEFYKYSINNFIITLLVSKPLCEEITRELMSFEHAYSCPMSESTTVILHAHNKCYYWSIRKSESMPELMCKCVVCPNTFFPKIWQVFNNCPV